MALGRKATLDLKNPRAGDSKHLRIKGLENLSHGSQCSHNLTTRALHGNLTFYSSLHCKAYLQSRPHLARSAVPPPGRGGPSLLNHFIAAGWGAVMSRSNSVAPTFRWAPVEGAGLKAAATRFRAAGGPSPPLRLFNPSLRPTSAALGCYLRSSPSRTQSPGARSYFQNHQPLQEGFRTEPPAADGES